MKTILFSLALLLFLGTCVRAQRSVRNDGFPVRTTVAQGELEGVYSTITGVRHYLGIPFAAPPTGDLRWRAPRQAENWEGIREAKTFGPRAVQKFLFDDMRFRSDGMNEDCLYLNVWTTAKKNDPPQPVLLYFHGGGNVAGSGDELRYDGEDLAKRGIIVVTANYRMGVFGFLAHPELSAETDHASGNYGLLDQVAALAWVRDNAAAFGGDPDRITIGGESAGSIDCSMLMASPLSRDLLAGVLGQSGAALLMENMQPKSPAVAEETGQRFLAATGYASIAELREAPSSDIYEAETNVNAPFYFPTVIDGYFLEESPLATYQAGRQAQVPLMVGWTSTETAWMPAPESREHYEATIRSQYGKNADEILRLYPSSDFARSNLALSSDNWIVLGTWKWADLHARTGKAPVYRYQFDRVRPPLVGQNREAEPPGAGHATDIEYFFNSLKKSDAYDWQEADEITAMQMSSYLINFVLTGNPHGDYLSPWPAMETGKTPPVMHLNDKTEIRPAANDDRYRFLESLLKQ